MVAEFSNIEKEILKGQATPVSRKFGCSYKYVKYIIEGDREINSDLSKKIYKNLNQILELLTPENTIK